MGRILELDVRGNGVYLTLYPDAKDTLSVKDLFYMLEDIGIKDYDRNALVGALARCDGKPLRICEWRPELQRDGSVEVEISSDKMEAFVRLLPPINGKDVSVEDVKVALEEAGVKFGIDESVITSVVKEKRYGESVLVAKGIPPEKGEDGYVEYKFNAFKKPKPVDLEGGKVDMRTLNIVDNVTKGQLLAVRIPSKVGKGGKNVLGVDISPPAVKDARILAGKNTEFSTDGNELYAATDGHVELKDGKITVSPVFIVRGDVDYAVGNIDFVGDVVVKGRVLPGFYVKAGGKIEVEGFVEGGFITAGEDVVIKMGIKGQGKSVIIASKDVFTKFVENATIEAGGNVTVGDSIINSSVKANAIYVSGKNGSIVGGECVAIEKIVVKSAGSNLRVKTFLEVGVDPRIKAEHAKIVKDLKVYEKKLWEMEKGVDRIKKVKEAQGKLPQKTEELYAKLTRARFQMMATVDRMKKRKEELEEVIDSFKREGIIVVTGVCYPGVRITIKGVSMVVNSEIKAVKFYYKDGNINMSPAD